MTRNKGIKRWIFSGCGLVLLAGMIAYAGQPQDTSTGAKASVDPPALFERAPDGTSAFSYQGPGSMVERIVPPLLGGTLKSIRPTSLLILSPGEAFRSQTIGFDLRWDKETVQAARAGELELFSGTGWLDIEYDTETGVLDIQVTEKSGEVFEVAYVLNPDGIVEESAFLAHVERFFEYMHGGPTAGSAARGPEGSTGGCTATNADGSVCCTGGPCAPGLLAQCTSGAGGTCSCGCYPAQ